MKKNPRYLLLLLLAAVVGLTATASDPSTYYNNAKNKSDQALMTALHNIIKGHTKRSYQQLWTDFKTTDCNGNIIIDRYSTTQYTYSTGQCGSYNGVGDCYNREHSIPNSWWGGSDSDTAYTDLHHMFPVDGFVNSKRGNYPFGDCNTGTVYGTGRLGPCAFAGYNGTVFEVADEYKGDFARVYFYFAIRYMPRISNYTSGIGSAVFTSNSYKCLTTWAINQLLEWHRNDPVSALETTRNDAVDGIQHNRNPFVDNPELVEYIWGNKQGSTWPSGGTTTPVLTSPTNGSTVNVGTNTGNGVSKTITVKGSNLTKSLTISVNGTGFSVSPTTVSAASANSGTIVTVTYNGTSSNATGTLTIISSEVSATVNLTASYHSGGGETGDEIIETWEGCSGYENYSNKSVQGKAFSWYFSNAGLFAQANDHWNDALGCRFGKNADSYIEMTEDVTDGASKLTFYAAKYGNDADPTMQIQYSTNGGSSWTNLATCSPNSTWQQYSYNLDVTGNVRFKFQQTAGLRLNIDDIAVTSNSGSVVTPTLSAPENGSTVDVGTIGATGMTVSKTITVKGSDLTKSLSVAVTGTGFTVTPTTISAANANAGTTVRVTYTSSTAGNATGKLTISSSEVSATVTLTASKEANPTLSAPENGSTVDVGTISATGTTVSKTITVKGSDLTKSLSVAVTGTGFTVTPTTISAANANAGTTVRVTYTSSTAGNATGKLTISSSEVSTTVNLTASKEANPTLSAPENGSTVDVGTISATGTTVSKTITVKGSDLTKSLSVAVTGTGFTVAPTTISAGNANAGTTVRVTYTSSTAGNATGTLTISSSEVSTTVNLTANKIAMPEISISQVGSMEAELNGQSSVVMATVSADNNNEYITLSVEGNFELSLNNRAWAKSLTLDSTGEVFYVRIADTSTSGDYYGLLTAATSLVSAYADLQGTVNEAPTVIGDVNMDGAVNIADVTTLIDYLLGSNVTQFDEVAADVNSDKVINIADVTALIDRLLSPSTYAVQQDWDACPAVGGIYVENYSRESLEIYDMEGDCCAVIVSQGEFSIELPAGIYVVASDTRSRKVVVK